MPLGLWPCTVKCSHGCMRKNFVFPPWSTGGLEYLGLNYDYVYGPWLCDLHNPLCSSPQCTAIRNLILLVLIHIDEYCHKSIKVNHTRCCVVLDLSCFLHEQIFNSTRPRHLLNESSTPTVQGLKILENSLSLNCQPQQISRSSIFL